MPSSTEIFERPFFNEGGKKDTELILEEVSSEPLFVVRAGAMSASVEGSSSSVEEVDNLDVLNTRPGPFPPPRIRSGAATMGAFCLGAGNIEINRDLPAPVPESNRGFFVAGLSSLSLSSSTLL